MHVFWNDSDRVKFQKCILSNIQVNPTKGNKFQNKVYNQNYQTLK